MAYVRKGDNHMPRPRKCRRICSMPLTDGFEPISNHLAISGEVVLNIDEYEVIRLIDLEKLTHEQCAVQMVVSRTTITGIYDAARYKIADALINGKRLVIEGGEFILCEHSKECCGKRCRHRYSCDEEGQCKKEGCHKNERRKRD